jgi:hypothetical protein
MSHRHVATAMSVTTPAMSEQHIVHANKSEREKERERERGREREREGERKKA